jgi:hypothetical protein
MRLKIEFFIDKYNFIICCNHAKFSNDYKEIRGFVPISPDSCTHDLVFCESVKKFSKIIVHFRDIGLGTCDEFYRIEMNIINGYLEEFDGNLSYMEDYHIKNKRILENVQKYGKYEK